MGDDIQHARTHVRTPSPSLAAPSLLREQARVVGGSANADSGGAHQGGGSEDGRGRLMEAAQLQMGAGQLQPAPIPFLFFTLPPSFPPPPP